MVYLKKLKEGGKHLKKKLFYTALLCMILCVFGCSGKDSSHLEQDTINNTDRLDTSDTSDYPDILHQAMPVGDGTISYIFNGEIEKNPMQELSFFQNNLLSSCFTYDTESNTDILHLRLLDLDSGKLLHEVQLPVIDSYSISVQALEDRIVVSDPLNGLIHIYDSSLTEISQYPVSGTKIYVNNDLTKAYCITDGSGLHVLTLDTQKEEILLPNTRDLSFCAQSENCITIRYIDLETPDKKECYTGLNLDTDNFEPFTIDDSFSEMEYLDGCWLSQIYSRTGQYLIGSLESPSAFTSDLSYPVMKLRNNASHLIITTVNTGGSSNLDLYQTDGTYLSSCSLEQIPGSFSGQLLWNSAANGYFLTVVDENGHDQLYFWDITKNASGNDLTLFSYYEGKNLNGTVLEQTYYDRANALSETYGVTIKIADLCATDYIDKIAEPIYDTEKIQIGLDTIEKAFSSYPEGFFRQLYYGNFRTIEINLMGSISNTEYVDGYYPTAFVQHEAGVITMVLNIDTDASVLEQNFYHESSHIIDKVLEHDALYRDSSLYSEDTWTSLNPESFISLNPENGGYFFSYEIMPMDYYQEAFTPYFVSDYAKTFPTEDRATIFETAMMGNSQIFTVNDPLRAKLSYYSNCIRDYFDTDGWPEYTAWELV